MGILDIFDKFRGVVILKSDGALERKVKELEDLKKKNPNNKSIEQELRIAKAGLYGENQIIYQLKKSNIGMFILHDINLVYEDLNAQIDFIVITPWACYFIECKNLIGDIIVDEKGDFIRKYNYNGKVVTTGMESPYRQVNAQRDVYKKIWFKIQGKLKSFLFERGFDDIHRILVVAANDKNILNTKYAPKDIKYNIVKVDSLIRKLEYDMEHSDRTLWSGKKEMEEWTKHFLKLNVIKEDEKSEESDNMLREKLVEFRKQRAKEKNIPAYYVFDNEELEKLLKLKPKTIDELREAKILKDIKINSHGKEIIELVN